MNNYKLCILGATFNTWNMGVSALTAGVVKCIIHQFPDAEVSFLDYGLESTISNFKLGNRNIPLLLINMRFSKKLFLQNNIVILLILSLVLKLSPVRLRNRIIHSNFCLRHISETNLAVSISGGDSFSDIYGFVSFIYVALPQLLVLFMGKDLVLLPQTIGPFKGRIAKVIAKYILNHARTVYSRDYASLEEIKDMPGVKNGSDHLRFCYDVGFVLDSLKPETMNIVGLPKERQDNSVIVGLNVSGLLYMGGYTKDNMFDLKVDYRKLTHGVIDYLVKQKNVHVLLVPHVFGSREHLESDSSVCEQLYEDLKSTYDSKISFARGIYNQSEIKYIIGQCDVFIGSRMHACIAALSQGIPTVSISYSKKFVGVMETIGVEALVADPRYLGVEEIIKVIDDTLVNRMAIRKHLESKMPFVKESVLKLFKQVVDEYKH